MVMPDKILLCRDCEREFSFSSGEQEFYAQKGYSEPGRCPECRQRRRGASTRDNCSQCGERVRDSQPMYCARCLEAAGLEAESKLRAEESLRLEQWQEQASAKLLRESEIGDEEKPAYATAGLEEVSPFDEELHLYVETFRLREQALMETLLDQSIARQFPDQSTFQQQLASQNLTPETLRERIAQQLVIESFIDANLDEDDLQVTDEEVEALYEYYSAQLDEVPSLGEVRPELENELQRQRISRAIDRLINELRAESKIEVFQ